MLNQGSGKANSYIQPFSLTFGFYETKAKTKSQTKYTLSLIPTLL
jgi:hypothetical protein